MANLPSRIAEHLRAVHFGGNWTAVCMKELLSDVDWQRATSRTGSFHTIAELVYHTGYFVTATLKVLGGGPLDAQDKYSFDCPPIASESDWQALQENVWADVEDLASLIEQMPEAQLWEPFAGANYGAYYRCLHGPIEHCHYHLGQIALLKKVSGTF